jgi:hypothetical protein
MSDINDEMKVAANYAIKSAKEKYGQELDFSELSIDKLENLLGQIYQTFSNNTNYEETNNIISETAIFWGSYLGEYMCLKWGGTWTLIGSDRLVSIRNILFSPIRFIHKKITSNPEYSVENYLIGTKRLIDNSVNNPQESQYLSENIDQPSKQISSKQSKIPVKIDKRLLFTLAGIGGILVVIVACIIGYTMIKSGGISAFGSIASATSSNTNIPIEKTLLTATSYSTNTPYPTVTPLPTYTPIPTYTQSPSFTPSLTFTQIATLTPTETQKPLPPTSTQAPVMSPTSVPVIPTNTRVQPTVLPPPTATQPPPIVIESCEINPSTVPIGYNVPIIFIVHFSSPSSGYGFETVIDLIYSGQSGCSGIDNDGDGMAYCDGSSGILPESTTVNVTFRSSVGDCVASYSSP